MGIWYPVLNSSILGRDFGFHRCIVPVCAHADYQSRGTGLLYAVAGHRNFLFSGYVRICLHRYCNLSGKPVWTYAGDGHGSGSIFYIAGPTDDFFNAKKARWFSPLSWISIEQLAPVKKQGYPALGYVILALLTLLLILSCVLMREKNKISIIGEVAM